MNSHIYNIVRFRQFIFLCLKVALKTNGEACSSTSQCCCGQYCYGSCDCSSNRWWNPDIPYCRNYILIYYRFRTITNNHFLWQKKNFAWHMVPLAQQQLSVNKPISFAVHLHAFVRVQVTFGMEHTAVLFFYKNKMSPKPSFLVISKKLF